MILDGWKLPAPLFAGKKAEYLQKLEVLFKAMDEARATC